MAGKYTLTAIKDLVDDLNEVTGSTVGSKRGLDINIIQDIPAQNEVVPLLREIARRLSAIEQHMELITEEKAE